MYVHAEAINPTEYPLYDGDLTCLSEWVQILRTIIMNMKYR